MNSSCPKVFACLLLSAFLPQACTVARADGVQAGDRVAACGDSITEQRVYTVYIEDYLLMCQPARVSTFQQIGWSGEAVPGLLKRIETDVLPFRPSVVTTLYGMNDGHYKPTNPETVAAFEKTTEDVIRALKAGGVRLVLVGSPGAVDTETFKTWFVRGSTPDEYNQTLLDLGQAAKAAAEKEGAVWVDVHAAMMAAMQKAKAKYGQAYALASDGVHPSGNGQIVMAYAFLKAMGFTGDIGTVTVDAASGRAEASEGHRVISSGAGRVEVESTRYPFCFVDDPQGPVSARSMLGCVPFNEELNRLTFVLRHAPPRVKLTWGGYSRVFDGAQVEAGINLAAEFPDNPFSEAFARVNASVVEQQAYETPAVKMMLNGLGEWRRYFPEERARWDEMRAQAVERDLVLNEAAHAAVKPVRHVIEWSAEAEAKAAPASGP